MIKIVYTDRDIFGRNTTEIDVNFHTFSGGEEHVNLTPFTTEQTLICARLDSSAEIMRLFIVTDAIRRMGNKVINLYMPYIPYARQDRVCQQGDAFSLKVFANLINAQGYENVYVSDAHSTVATALIENVTEFPQSDYAWGLVHAADNLQKYNYIISPDAGASKKSIEFSKRLNSLGWDTEVVQALKVRDPATGNITKTELLVDNLDGADCLIVDDICSGGMTFRLLARELKAMGAGKIGLYITHGIFDYGVDVLFNDNIDHIYTTDSFEQKDSRVQIIHKFFS